MAVRHSVLNDIEGGWARLLAIFLKRFLREFTEEGIPLRLNNEIYVLRAKLTDLLSDGDGLRMAFDWNGAASMRPCLKHKNVLPRDTGLEAPNFVDICCHEPSLFQRSIASDLALAADTVCAASLRVGLPRGDPARMTKERFTELCKGMGFRANPMGVLAQVSFRSQFDIVEVACFDWVHTQLQDGVLAKEVYLFIEALGALGVNMSSFEGYLSNCNWVFPKVSRCKAKALYRCFNEYRIRSSERADKLKCTASELLGFMVLCATTSRQNYRPWTSKL